MHRSGTATQPKQQEERDLVGEMEALRADVLRRNPGLTEAQADEIAEELTSEAIDSLVEQGKVSFQRDR